MNVAFALLFATFIVPTSSFAQEIEWPGIPWETASCPRANVEHVELKAYGSWDDEDHVFIENRSYEIWSGPSNSPDFHIRWIGGDVEILCGDKFVFIGTTDNIVIEIATPMKKPKE